MKLRFDKCPHCGSEETISSILGKEAQEKGNFGKDEEFNLYGFQSVVANPNKPERLILSRKTVTAVVVVNDVCSKCGTMWAKSVETQDGVLQAQVDQKPKSVKI